MAPTGPGASVPLAPSACPSPTKPEARLPGRPLILREGFGGQRDGSTVAYTTFGPKGDHAVGVITGGRTRQWAVLLGAVQSLSGVSVSGNGVMLAFTTSHGNTTTAWVLQALRQAASRPRPGRSGLRRPSGGAGHAVTDLESALISPDGREIYLCFAATSAQRKTVTRVIAYRTADKASLGAIATRNSGNPTTLTPGRRVSAHLGSGLVRARRGRRPDRVPPQPGDPHQDDSAASRIAACPVRGARLVTRPAGTGRRGRW